MGIGAGVGVAQTIITEQYDMVIPYLPSNFNKLSNAGNVIIGGLVFGISYFTTLVRSKSIPLYEFLTVYGFTTLIGGLINTFLPSTTTARASGAGGYVATLPGGRNGYITHDYYPNFTGTFVRRPASRAKGFASDVTINPMAAIPTTIPYNKILS